MLNIARWRRYSGTFSLDENLPVDKIYVDIVANDAEVRDSQNRDTPLYITDIHFQPGNQVSGWMPETREMTRKILHTNDENATKVTSGDIYEGGKEPIRWENVEFSEYNIAGRGIEVFTLPNWYPEDYALELLPTGVNFEITPKNDYDFFRLCTNSGSLKREEDLYDSKDLNHPLNIAYTREFSIGAGKAGDTIKILSRTGEAFRGSSKLDIGGVNTITLGDGKKLPIRKRSFFLAQKGAMRYRFEFYKLVDGKLTDTGIGYQGTAYFNQWTFGRSRI